MTIPAAPAAIVVGAVFGLTGLALDAATGHAGQTLVAEAHWHGFSAALKIHQWHAVALLATGSLLLRYESLWWRLAAVAFVVGVILFSGGLYLTVVGFTVGFVTPVGGLVLMLGWVLLGVGGWFARRE